MPRADRGSIWILDLGLAAKVTMSGVKRAHLTLRTECGLRSYHIPLAYRGTRFETASQTKILQGGGVFDAQQIVNVPQAKLVRKLGDMPPDQLVLVETTVRVWLDL